jgi:drug/metabolite transporter (DMT)-like permease
VRIHDYMYPKNVVYTTVAHTVYGTFRLVCLPLLMCVAPWTLDEIHPVLYFVYLLFTLIIVASYRWFRFMTRSSSSGSGGARGRAAC